MIRRILGFAVLAVVVWLALQLAFGILGTLIGLVITVLWLAVIGYACYLILRVVSPTTAAKVRELIRGRPTGVA
jgi:hypothetical protein